MAGCSPSRSLRNRLLIASLPTIRALFQVQDLVYELIGKTDWQIPSCPPGVAARDAAGDAPESGYVTDRHGYRLFYRAWPARGSPARAVLVAVDGMGSSANQFSPIGPVVASRGIVFFGLDVQGQGLSEGPRSDWTRLGEIREGIDDFLQQASQRYPGRPLYLLGESIGGPLVLELAAGGSPPPNLAGLVLASPELEPTRLTAEGGWQSALMILKQLPYVLFASPAPSVDISGRERLVARDPAVYERSLHDPLRNNRVSTRTIAVVLALIARAYPLASRTRVPTLVLQAACDRVNDPEAAASLLRCLATGDKALVYFDGAAHGLFYDPDTPRVVRVIADWIEGHLGQWQTPPQRCQLVATAPPARSDNQVDCPLRPVQTKPRSFECYRPFATADQFDAVLDRARKLRGLRVVEINSTPAGGGVATLLASILPVLQGLGLAAHWYSMCADPAFFSLTKKLNNLLQGDQGALTQAERDLYRRVSEQLAGQVARLSPDVLVIHDPQPAGLLGALSRGPSVGSLWRGHIDLSQPDPGALAFFEPFLSPYDLIVLEVPAYRLPGIPGERQRFVPDAIDPLAVKNQLMTRDVARLRMAEVGIDRSRPVVTQVARFDPQKNPIGVVEAFRGARQSVRGLQLAMLGTFVAQDDPTARMVYDEVKRFVGDDPDVHLYSDPAVIGDQEVAAFQAGSDAILLFSRREGFGIAATEAMWKSNAVIAGDVGGLRLQIEDGVNGFRVRSVAECAERIVELVCDRALALQIGRQAHETVRAHYLLPRLICDRLSLFEQIADRVYRTGKDGS